MRRSSLPFALAYIPVTYKEISPSSTRGQRDYGGTALLQTFGFGHFTNHGNPTGKKFFLIIPPWRSPSVRGERFTARKCGWWSPTATGVWGYAASTRAAT